MTSLDVDVLTVRKIYAKGNNNQILAPNTVLTTDGLGGTFWTSLSSINAGLTYNTFTTSLSTFTSSPGNTQFSILDNSNIGLLPTNSGTAVTLYSKSFGQIDVPGQASVNSFNNTTGQFNNKFSLLVNGTLSISTNSATNQIFLSNPNDVISSFSSFIKNMSNVNSTISNSLTVFNSPFSTFIYSAISSFSTSLGPTVIVPQLNTALSSFSTALGPITTVPQLNTSFSSFSTLLGPTVNTLTFASTLSTTTNANFFTTNLNTSSITLSGNRQPFIQYGSGVLTSGSGNVRLNTNYVNSSYIIQMTYQTGSNTFFVPLSFSGVTTSNFLAHGDTNASVFHWTTYGNLF
uniref:Uncharacterized protein n=1 Tax=viral metagenome TaxID=1070528 RepID=A0A6C0AP86_9ZZZZ